MTIDTATAARMSGNNNNTEKQNETEKMAAAVPSEKEDRILTVLRDATKGSSHTIVDNRSDYQHRLLSFQASTYYAKPACLSPLFCARFGWRNADEDMLSCSSCSSAVAILPLPSKLSTTSLDKLCHAYRKKIATSHTDECPFRLNASQFESLDTPNDTTAVVSSSVVPSYMASVLPEESVLLLEHPAPQELLRTRIQEIQGILTTNNNQLTPPVWKYPHLQIPKEICEFASAMGNDVLGTDDESIVGLAILGWKPVERVIEDKSPLVVSMGCPLCMTLMELECALGDASGGNEKDKEQDGNDRPTKRLRTLAKHCNPQEAHRHYCPYKCGFPKSITDSKDPVWKPVLERLSDTNRSTNNPLGDSNGKTDSSDAVPLEEMDESIRKVRQILRAGMAPKTIDLSS